jgi:hypothetical protein
VAFEILRAGGGGAEMGKEAVQEEAACIEGQQQALQQKRGGWTIQLSPAPCCTRIARQAPTASHNSVIRFVLLPVAHTGVVPCGTHQTIVASIDTSVVPTLLLPPPLPPHPPPLCSTVMIPSMRKLIIKAEAPPKSKKGPAGPPPPKITHCQIFVADRFVGWQEAVLQALQVRMARWLVVGYERMPQGLCGACTCLVNLPNTVAELGTYLVVGLLVTRGRSCHKTCSVGGNLPGLIV